MSHAVFSLPRSFRLDKFIRSVMAFTVVVEAGGAAALYVIFRQAGKFPSCIRPGARPE